MRKEVIEEMVEPGMDRFSHSYLSTVGMKGKPELIGKINGKEVWLSIQTGSWAFCRPRKFLPRLRDFKEVELGVLADGKLVRPRDLGVLADMDHYWKGDPVVAQYVPLEKVNEIRRRLLDAAK